MLIIKCPHKIHDPIKLWLYNDHRVPIDIFTPPINALMLELFNSLNINILPFTNTKSKIKEKFVHFYVSNQELKIITLVTVCYNFLLHIQSRSAEEAPEKDPYLPEFIF